MSSSLQHLEQRIAQLEQELRLMHRRESFSCSLDNLLEEAIQGRWTLEKTLRRVMPLLVEQAQALTVQLRTYDEDLVMHDFCFPASTSNGEATERSIIDEVLVKRTPRCISVASGCVLARPLDVAGELFGAVALRFDHTLPPAEQEHQGQMLGIWCEELDNFLAAIACSRNKHQIIQRLSQALKEPVLDRGIYNAIEVLRGCLSFDDVLLVYHHEEESRGLTLDYKIIKDGKLLCDSQARRFPEIDQYMHLHAQEMISGTTQEVLDRFDIKRYQEEVLINGVKNEHVIGRLIIARQTEAFNTFDRDLLDIFSDYLCRRIVDFNREWRDLCRSFPQREVFRMLSHEDYQLRFLTPQEHEVAILFCDITSFTRISEQVLQSPTLIGQLIDTWSKAVVEIIWRWGGVFDKMVGDCVIGIWGPPFFESTPQEMCQRAAQAAWAVKEFSTQMAQIEGLSHLASLESPFGVATGLNYCPLCVGIFGPDENYTGFSSGMNNAARLQSIATRDEILCMESFAQTLGVGQWFGEQKTSKVKNVAQPLIYFPLLAPPPLLHTHDPD